MLILRRREGQSFRIADDIVVEVLEVQGNRVKLGILAPADCTIVRSEIAATEIQNQTAARSWDTAGLAELAGELRRNNSFFPQTPTILSDE